MIKPAYSVSFLLSINIFVWQNVLYFLDAPRNFTSVSSRLVMCFLTQPLHILDTILNKLSQDTRGALLHAKHQYFKYSSIVSSDHIKIDMGGASGMYGGQKKCIQGLG